MAAALALVAFAALALAGCGETVIDSAKTEGALEHNLRSALHEQVSSVQCPSDVKVQPGASFQCTVNLAGGRTETATLKILDKEADVRVIGLSAKK